jgi:hypothetical protein
VSCRWGEKRGRKGGESMYRACRRTTMPVAGKLYIKLKEEEKKHWKENWQNNPQGK